MFKVVAVVLVANILVSIWIDKHYSVELQKLFSGVGRFEICFGVTAKGYRDFDLTIQIEPGWYVNFQLSLWTPFIGGSWSRDVSTFPDCDHEGTRCATCGCPNKCGEQFKE